MLGIETKSKINTPVDTALLRNSHRSKFGDLSGEVSTNTDYDLFVHYGTKFMPARPFMEKAVEASQEQVNRYMKDAVQDTLDSIARAAP